MRTLALALTVALAAIGAACARPAQTAPTAAAPAAASPVAVSPMATAAGQPAATPNGRIGGLIQGIDHGTVVLQGGDHFALSPDALIIRSVQVNGSALQAGEFVAVTAKRQPDGSLLASIVNIFPESMRGLGEGQRPMDGGNLMTNATIGDVAPNLMTNATVDNVAGGSFDVQFPGGGDDVKLADDAQVNRFEAADVGDLVPGTTITAFVNDGTAQFVTIM